MSEFDDGWRYLPQGEKQIPLWFKYECKPLWADLEARLGVGPTGAATAVALYDGALVGKATSYSRNSNWYGASRGRHPLLTLSKMRNAVAVLEQGGWIKHYKQVPGGRGWQSAMEATPDLVALIQGLLVQRPKLRLLPPRETIILRDEDGRLIDYKDTREIDRKRRRAEAFNEAICGLDIVSADGVSLAAPMARIYNIDPRLSRGGRFYGMGASWQNVRSEVRKAIAINGEAVVELDFKTLHPAMLYGEAGVRMPADCYDVGDGWSRPLVKVGMLTLINASKESSARHSIAHSQEMIDHCQAVGVPVAPGSQEALRLASNLIGTIKAKHKPIASAFHSDAGARLMRKDSDMAESVMALLMLRKDIPVLPVHDSFLVPASKRDELEAAMMQAAYDIGLSEIRVTEAK